VLGAGESRVITIGRRLAIADLAVEFKAHKQPLECHELRVVLAVDRVNTAELELHPEEVEQGFVDEHAVPTSDASPMDHPAQCALCRLHIT